MSDIANRFKQIREDKHLTITTMATVLLENRQRIQDIESGKQRVPEDVILKYIEHFNIDANWLLTGNGNMYRNIPQNELDPEIQAVVTIMKKMDRAQKTTIRANAENIEQLIELKQQVSALTMRQSA